MIDDITQLKACKVFDDSNDNTFNVVVNYGKSNSGASFVVIKSGGIITSNSISRPIYKVIDTDGRKLFDNYSTAFDYVRNNYDDCVDCKQSEIVHYLDDDHYIHYVFASDYTISKIVDSIIDVLRTFKSSQINIDRVVDQCIRFKSIYNCFDDIVNQKYGLKLLDQINKAVKVINDNKLNVPVTLLNNLVCFVD